MRGTRAKKIRRLAVKIPSPIVTGFYKGTFIHGGARRSYQALKKFYRRHGYLKAS